RRHYGHRRRRWQRRRQRRSHDAEPGCANDRHEPAGAAGREDYDHHLKAAGHGRPRCCPVRSEAVSEMNSMKKLAATFALLVLTASGAYAQGLSDLATIFGPQYVSYKIGSGSSAKT